MRRHVSSRALIALWRATWVSFAALWIVLGVLALATDWDGALLWLGAGLAFTSAGLALLSVFWSLGLYRHAYWQSRVDVADQIDLAAREGWGYEQIRSAFIAADIQRVHGRGDAHHHHG